MAFESSVSPLQLTTMWVLFPTPTVAVFSSSSLVPPAVIQMVID